MCRIKFKLVKFERGIALQILEMDERFRKEENSFESSHDYHGFKIFFKSYTYPAIRVDVNSMIFFLLGQNRSCDFNVISPSRLINFKDNDDRDKFCDVLTDSFVEWANEWEGFKDDFENRRVFFDGDSHNKYLMINDDILIKYQLELLDKGIAFKLLYLHEKLRNDIWQYVDEGKTYRYFIGCGCVDNPGAYYFINREGKTVGDLFLGNKRHLNGETKILTIDFKDDNDRDVYYDNITRVLRDCMVKLGKDYGIGSGKLELKKLGNDTYEI